MIIPMPIDWTRSVIEEDELIAGTRARWEGRANVERFVEEIERTEGPQHLKNAIEGKIVQRFVQGDHILDAGIGTGRMSLPLMRTGLHVTGIDASAAMIERCARDPRAKPVRLVVGDIADLPFAAQAFDTVMAVDTFAYIAAWRAHLDELVRVTRSGGRIILNVGSRDHWAAVAAQRMRDGAPAASPSECANALQSALSVAELQSFADERELTLAAIVPYGAIFGTLVPNGWLTASYAYRSGALDRLVSWIGADPRLSTFAEFIERRIVGVAAPTIGSSLFALFERRPADPGTVVRDVLPLVADNDERGAAVWRAELDAHLQYEPNRSFAVALLLAAAALRLPPAIHDEMPDGLMREIERVERAVEIDAAAAAARAAWTGRSADYLTFHGVDLSNVFAGAVERELRSAMERGA